MVIGGALIQKVFDDVHEILSRSWHAHAHVLAMAGHEHELEGARARVDSDRGACARAHGRVGTGTVNSGVIVL